MCKKLQLLGDFVPQAPYRGFAPGPHCETSIPEPPYWPLFILGLSGGNPSPQKNQKSSPEKFDETEEPEARIHALPSRTKSLDFLNLAAPSQTPLGSLQRSQVPHVDLRGPTFKGREGSGREGKEGDGRGGEGTAPF